MLTLGTIFIALHNNGSENEGGRVENETNVDTFSDVGFKMESKWSTEDKTRSEETRTGYF